MTGAARMEMSVTVVVAAWNDSDLLRKCLRSLAMQRGPALEVIVACAAGRGFEAALDELPETILVAVPGDATVPVLRAAGLARATGDVVAFLEDHAVVAPEWADALATSYRGGDVRAVGGPVGQAPGMSTFDWAAYLFDYGRFMPPMAPGPTRELSGLNMSFTRELLGSLGDTLRDGVMEGPLHEELFRRGIARHLAPAAIVYQTKRYSLRETLVFVYYLGRGYAGRRMQGATRSGRLARMSGSVLLPALLVWRVLSAALPKGKDTGRILGAAGYLCLIALAWSLGEAVGYAAGVGDSESHWRRGTA